MYILVFSQHFADMTTMAIVLFLFGLFLWKNLKGFKDYHLNERCSFGLRKSSTQSYLLIVKCRKTY